jgi:hypothetical protein
MIATGGMVPRGADAVVMVEHTEVDTKGRSLEITRAAAPGENVSFAGTDIAKGETVLRAGQLLTSREIGVLAAIGLAEVSVCRKPRVAILSTGNEIVAPGSPLLPARSTIPTPLPSAPPSKSSAQRRYSSESFPTTIAHWAQRLLALFNMMSSCSPAERPKAQATFRIASSASSRIRASSRTASRSSRGSRFASR